MRLPGAESIEKFTSMSEVRLQKPGGDGALGSQGNREDEWTACPLTSANQQVLEKWVRNVNRARGETLFQGDNGKKRFKMKTGPSKIGRR